MPLRDDPLRRFRVHVFGCPHSCAKHQVADLGLSGALAEDEGQRVEAFVAYVGGNTHERRLGTAKIRRPLVLPALRALLKTYEAAALPGERFSASVARPGPEPYFATLEATLPRGLPRDDATAPA